MPGTTDAAAVPDGTPSPLPPLTDTYDALYGTQYGVWYRDARRFAPKTTVVDVEAVEPTFLDWLDADSLVLGDDGGAGLGRAAKVVELSDDDEAGRGEEGDDDDDDDDEGIQFPALSAVVRDAVAEYGAVFPKLNWSAPLDASWIMPGNTLRCQTPNDVYLLVKSSDFAMKDLGQMRELQACGREPRPRLELVLKKWFEMPKAHEFRVFVRAGHAIAACQRDVTFYEHLQDADTQARIAAQLRAFYENEVAHMPCALADMVFDVYLTRTLERCFLIDINPWLPRTDPLLWTYDELDEAAPHPHALRSPIPLRLLTSAAQASQSMPTYSANMYPADVVEIGSGQDVAAFARTWQETLAQAAAG
ncbi:hypothetical protein MSPP1_001081 [Malassezia sp. CBS 17886]|nr:hypothetical protein MSPP1_001081 [Malassezia sp. CBS 17886]